MIFLLEFIKNFHSSESLGTAVSSTPYTAPVAGSKVTSWQMTGPARDPLSRVLMVTELAATTAYKQNISEASKTSVRADWPSEARWPLKGLTTLCMSWEPDSSRDVLGISTSNNFNFTFVTVTVCHWISCGRVRTCVCVGTIVSVWSFL